MNEAPAASEAQADTPATPALRVVAGDGGLVAHGVGKTYKKRPVVRNVSVRVRRGEAVGLLGPNGAGKTTTFYMIMGLVRPDARADISARWRGSSPCTADVSPRPPWHRLPAAGSQCLPRP